MTDQRTIEAINEINDKVTRWKDLLHRRINLGIDGSQYSYIEILKANADLTTDFFKRTINDGLTKIGGFSWNAKSLLGNAEKTEAQDICEYLHHSSDYEQLEEFGAFIAKPPHFPNQKFGFIFHAKPFKMIEAFYETEDPVLLQLPDTFLYNYDMFMTVRAVKSLNEKPELKEAIEKLKL